MQVAGAGYTRFADAICERTTAEASEDELNVRLQPRWYVARDMGLEIPFNMLITLVAAGRRG